MHTKRSLIEKKDFSSEIRGRRDIDGFVANSEVLLDIHENQLEAIVDRLLDTMFSKDHKISTISAARYIQRQFFCKLSELCYNRRGILIE